MKANKASRINSHPRRSSHHRQGKHSRFKTATACAANSKTNPSPTGQPTSLSMGGQTVLQNLVLSPDGQPLSWDWVMGAGTPSPTNPTTISHTLVRDTQGRIIRQPLGNLVRDISYDAAGRITAYTHYTVTGASNGTPTGYASPQHDQRFAYDTLGRLVQVSTTAGTWAYQYDANGNRTQVQASSAASPGTPATTRIYTTQATSNRLQSITNPSVQLNHDAAGNMTGDGNFTLATDARGRLAQTQSSGKAPTTYTHDNQGLRLRKHGTLSAAGDAGTLAFVYDHSPTAGGLPSSYPRLLGEYNASGQPVREYIWLGDTPVAIAMADPANPLGQPKLYSVHTDHLNTPQVVMDRSTAAMRWRWMTEPFGTTQPEESINGTAAFTQPLRFPGQYADGETGMAYNVMRSYIPGVGRYSQSDPIGLAGGINTFGYVGGNPVSYIDPEGLQAYPPGYSPLNPGFFGSLNPQRRQPCTCPIPPTAPPGACVNDNIG